MAKKIVATLALLVVFTFGASQLDTTAPTTPQYTDIMWRIVCKDNGTGQHVQVVLVSKIIAIIENRYPPEPNPQVEILVGDTWMHAVVPAEGSITDWQTRYIAAWRAMRGSVGYKEWGFAP